MPRFSKANQNHGKWKKERITKTIVIGSLRVRDHSQSESSTWPSRPPENVSDPDRPTLHKIVMSQASAGSAAPRWEWHSRRKHVAVEAIQEVDEPKMKKIYFKKIEVLAFTSPRRSRQDETFRFYRIWLKVVSTISPGSFKSNGRPLPWTLSTKQVSSGALKPSSSQKER